MDEMTEAVRTSWEEYEGIGPDRAEALRKTFETPKAFVTACKEQNPNAPMYASLELMRLTEAEGVGHGIASSIVDQMVKELVEI